MCPVLVHIYGPFSINAYGFFIAVGLLSALFLARRDPRKQALITDDQGITLISGCIIAAILGGRLLHVLMEPSQFTSWYDLIAFWQGGGAELGGIIAVIIFLLCALKYYHLKVLPLLDLASTYAPLLQGFGRIGCFFAGCCYGAPTNVAWRVLYTHPLSLAPLNVALHPTQLYSALLFFIAFVAMYALSGDLKKPGQCFMLYLMATSTIRFIVDFWRDDRVFLETLPLFSSYQLLALGIFFLGVVGFMLCSRTKKA